MKPEVRRAVAAIVIIGFTPGAVCETPRSPPVARATD